MAPEGRFKRRRFPRSAAALLVLFGVLVAGAAIWGLPNSEDDLTARSQRSLAAAGYNDLDVTFEGRDAVLRGDVVTDLDAIDAEDLVYGLRGVRRVDRGGVRFFELAEPSSAADPGEVPTAITAAITIAIEGGNATLTGTMPTQAAVDAIAATAAARYDTVVDMITVDPTVSPPSWLDSLDGLVAGLDGLDPGSVAISNAGITLEGYATDQETRAAIAFAVGAAAGLGVDNRLQLLGPSMFVAVADDDAVSLRGTLADQDAVDAVVAAAEAEYETVDNDLAAGGVRRTDWTDDLPGLFEATSGWSRWDIELDDDEGTFGGLAPSTAALERLRDGYLDDLNVGKLDFEAELEAAAVADELTELLEGSATFVVGSIELSDEAILLLDEAIEVLLANPSTVLTVEGHTDDQGGAPGNLILSQDRAQAVVDYLVAGGIDEDRLTAIGYGEERPIGDNDTSEGRAENRRIEFVVEGEV